MTHADDFLRSYSAIERHLRKSVGSDRFLPFYQLVDAAATHSSAIRRFSIDLKEFADLRNAIVHERTDGHPIAEPNARAVRELGQLERYILAPPTIYPAFHSSVATIAPTDTISEAVALMSTNKYSQMPVLLGERFVGLLSANTIARWLGSEVSNDLVSLAGTTIKDVLRHTEHPDNHMFVARNCDLFKILDVFDAYETKGRRLEAVLITHNGSPQHRLLGIITVHDIPKVLRTISLRR